MITNLDEAIQHCLDVAEREQQKGFFANIKVNRPTEYGTKCYECAKEHRQLAEWLRKLKAYEEADEEIAREMNNGQWSEAVAYGMGNALVIMRKHMREVNADGDSN